ncbi:hypothetical protein M405DRAFT_859144 [Rhizopogon salebrosus TDB-379]|nr:hypothetical protein M405DRAFT_859144 [Rhizopogon salebrosus TDB-379]
MEAERTAIEEKKTRDVELTRVAAETAVRALAEERARDQAEQLRPKVNNYNLTVEKGGGFELNRSLFERLVLKSFPHQTLTAFQNRSSSGNDCLCQAFDSVHLNEQAQEAFTILLRLINLSIGNAASSYREVTKKPSILSELFNSSQQIFLPPSILAHLSLLQSVDRGPGGRHDDDFVDFREISILPTADGILSQQPPFLRPSGVLEDSDGGETRAADYLDNTFRLLREEMINEMREELQTALGKKKGRHHGLFINGVKLDGPISIKTPQALKLTNITLSLHPFGNQIVSFGSIHRVEELLAQKPPSPDNTWLIQIDTALFAFEEVSKALQNMQFIPISDELLFWKDGNLIGSVLVAATQTPSCIVLDMAGRHHFSQDSRGEFLSSKALQGLENHSSARSSGKLSTITLSRISSSSVTRTTP